MDDATKRNPGRELMERGAAWVDIPVAAATAAVAWCYGDPQSLAAAALTAGAAEAARRWLSATIADLAGRALSRREKRRLGEAACHAGNLIFTRLVDGETPRDDLGSRGSVEDEGDFPGRDLLEGVLLKCRDEYESKKVRHIDSIAANWLFRPEVTAEMGNLVLNIAHGLTYRQLCMLSLLRRADEFQVDATVLAFRIRPTEGLADPAAFVEQDFSVLHNHGLIAPQILHGMPSYLNPLGTLVYDLMSLGDADPAALAELRSRMSR